MRQRAREKQRREFLQLIEGVLYASFKVTVRVAYMGISRDGVGWGEAYGARTSTLANKEAYDMAYAQGRMSALKTFGVNFGAPISPS